jgi:hypothetical protein
VSDVERETYLRGIRRRAWQAILAASGTPEQVFAAAAEVYERELLSRMSLEGTAEFLGLIADVRDAVYRARDTVGNDPADDYARLGGIIDSLDSVLGPDLLREADPTGEILKPLSLAERKRALDVLDSVQKVIDERGGGQPPYIVIVEDETGPLLEAAKKRRERDAAAERMSDYLTQLGVDPDETFEGDTRTTAQILADVALKPDGPVEVGSPEHQASERLIVAQMAKSDVDRGEG